MGEWLTWWGDPLGCGHSGVAESSDGCAAGAVCSRRMTTRPNSAVPSTRSGIINVESRSAAISQGEQLPYRLFLL